jgi:hypothetical protein
VIVQEVRWDKGVTLRAGDYKFFSGKGNRIMNWEQDFLYAMEYYQQLREYSLLTIGCHIYIVLRGCWCNIVVLNVHVLSEEKSDDSSDNFYKELEQVFDHFPKYHMKILLGDFNAKVGRGNICKPTIGNESVHQDSNDNDVATSRNLVVKSTVFPHRNIHR